MTEAKNEVMVNYDTETGEVLTGEQVHEENDKFKVVKLTDGTFKKNMKYEPYFSRVAKTDEEKIELYKVFNDSDNGIVTPFNNMIGKEITIAHVFKQPYESFDEKTGKTSDGVTTTIQDVDGSYYATSSKTVYYTIDNIMQTFGYPTDEHYKPVKVKVTGTKRKNGVQIDLELIGF